MAHLSIEEVAERVRKHIGETFPYSSKYKYPHGEMQYARLLSVDEKCLYGVTIEVEFTDGFKAEYCTNMESFYEHTILPNL